MSKTKEAVSDAETATRVKRMLLSREQTKNEVDTLFDHSHEARKTATKAVERLFLQAGASQNQHPFMQKEGKVFGASEPDELRHGEIPYKHRRAAYVDYLKKKSNEKPTGMAKSTLVGGGVGGLLGAGIGALAHRKPGMGAGLGAAAGTGLGALAGLIAGKMDKSDIQKAKKKLESGNIDKHVSKAISSSITRHEAAQIAKEHGPGLAATALRAYSDSKQREHDSNESSADREHEKWKHEASRPKPYGKCANCGAPAPSSGYACTHCGKKEFTKSAAASVIEFFEKKAHLTHAQRLFPELLKVGATDTQKQMVTKKPAGATPTKPLISGDQQ